MCCFSSELFGQPSVAHTYFYNISSQCTPTYVWPKLHFNEWLIIRLMSYRQAFHWLELNSSCACIWCTLASFEEFKRKGLYKRGICIVKYWQGNVIGKYKLLINAQHGEGAIKNKFPIPALFVIFILSCLYWKSTRKGLYMLLSFKSINLAWLFFYCPRVTYRCKTTECQASNRVADS